MVSERLTRAPEKETLLGYLDFHRDIVLWKLEGLDDEQLRRTMTPTGMSMLGLVKHLAYVEYGWFLQTFAGKPPPPDLPWDDGDPAMDWRIEPGETTAQILTLYRSSVETARAIAAEADLDALSVEETRRRGRVSMRWILLHMLEEIARHNGHLDVMREQIDGVVGDYPEGTPVVAP